jgi:transcriptional regulator with XRE-family HTH domain
VRLSYAPAPGMREAREAAGMSLEELAAQTGYPAYVLAELERGTRPAPRIVTSRISAVLGATTVDVRGAWSENVTRIKDVLPTSVERERSTEQHG